MNLSLQPQPDLFRTRLISELCTVTIKAVGRWQAAGNSLRAVDEIITVRRSFDAPEVPIPLGDSPQSRCIAHLVGCTSDDFFGDSQGRNPQLRAS